ncbi:hypothetical protein EPUS_04438 [Endocarpon pusillum Z07020]|uniref:SET domain-containing protein n=1 Tax=Endocarpon pusillum (strain Z07020 / HMAS-L-300199) TaxID=1263415 RepID=U1GVX1_ENDPU|nr:uncharacterized protein EPUS_04438 [Endocarpon pusillum Z07020]ERF76618.1 hypothetical protein EPUS_04438 [Endocarpon pusillum Z07020]
MATNTDTTESKASSEHAHNTRYKGVSEKKRKPSLDWDDLEERGKRRRGKEGEKWRRRNSVTHLVASIYADVEAAVETQRRIAGQAPILTQEERLDYESSEDMRLDHLREFRLAQMFSSPKTRNRLRAAPVPRGRRFDSVRAGRDVVTRAVVDKWRLLNTIIDTLGWVVIAICLHSANFRTRFLEATDAVDFTERLEKLRLHKESIEFFAKSRQFDWLEVTTEQEEQDVLLRDLNCLLTGTAIPKEQEINEDEAEDARLNADTKIAGFPNDGAGLDHPHEWKLSADGLTAVRLTFLPGGGRATLQLQSNIEHSVVLPGHRWPDRKKWILKEEPRYRAEFDESCEACNDPGAGEGKKWRAGCQCSVNNLKTRLAADGAYFGDRVELRNVHPILGTGVRALQRLPAHSLLAEYTGEIYPLYKTQQRGKYKNSTYLYCQTRRLSNGEIENAMNIDPSIHGNWTRFINHSCRPKTDFVLYSCGEKIVTCVKVRKRAIEFGEEITIDYGKSYFENQGLACRCREDACRLWNADKMKDNRTTLRQARQEGFAPDWADD